jgi:hypothetical protein
MTVELLIINQGNNMNVELSHVLDHTHNQETGSVTITRNEHDKITFKIRSGINNCTIFNFEDRDVHAVIEMLETFKVVGKVNERKV